MSIFTWAALVIFGLIYLGMSIYRRDTELLTISHIYIAASLLASGMID